MQICCRIEPKISDFSEKGVRRALHGQKGLKDKTFQPVQDKQNRQSSQGGDQRLFRQLPPQSSETRLPSYLRDPATWPTSHKAMLA
jgi:hypothetical protein